MAGLCCGERRAIFVGLARNCAWFLPTVLQNIERLAGLYRESAVVIVENDSDDCTKSILRSWLATQPNGTLIELDGLVAREPIRTQRIAVARNAAMEYIRTSRMGAWDHLVVLDLDDVNSAPISCDKFDEAANFLESTPVAAGIFANQLTAYYDIWALRSSGWCNADCWKQVAAKPKWLDTKLAKTIFVHARQVAIPEQSQPIRVKSAFGGLAIYKLSATADCKYYGLDADGMEVCEHVGFNEQISAGGRELFIYPGLLNQASNAHLFDPGRFGRREKLLLNLINWWQTVFPPWH